MFDSENTREPTKRLPRPWMRSASASTDVGGIGFAYAERRSNFCDCDRG